MGTAMDGLAIMIAGYIAMRCVEIWLLSAERYSGHTKGVMIVVSLICLAATLFGLALALFGRSYLVR